MSLASRIRAESTAQAIATVIGSVLVVILARLLEPSGYGLLFLALSVLGIPRLVAQLGIGTSAARYIVEYRDEDPTQIPHILVTSILLNLATITVTVVVILLTYEWIADLVGAPELAPFLLVGTLFLVFGTLTRYLRNTLQGFEAIHEGALVRIVNRGGRLLFAVGLVLLGYGALGALGGYIIGAAMASVVGLLVLYVRYYRRYLPASPIEAGLRRRIAEYMIPLSAADAANVLDKRVDTILVGFFLNPVAVGYYTIGKQVVDFLKAPIAALNFSVSPTLGAETAKGNADRATRLYEISIVNALLLYLPAAAGVVLVADPLVPLVFGTGYADAVPVVQVFSLYLVVRAINSVTTGGLNFLGRARSRAISQGVTATLNVVLNVLLIPTIGVIGAVIATVITYSLYTAANVYFISQEFDLRIAFLLRKTSLVVGVTAVMSGAVFLASGFVEGWLSLLVLPVVGVAVWAPLSLLTGLLDVQQARRLVNG